MKNAQNDFSWSRKYLLLWAKRPVYVVSVFGGTSSDRFVLFLPLADIFTGALLIITRVLSTRFLNVFQYEFRNSGEGR